MPPKGGFSYDDIHSVTRAIVAERSSQGIVVPDIHRHVDSVEQHVGGTEKVRERLLLDAMNGFLKRFFVFGAPDVLASYVLDSTGKEPARTAGGVQKPLAKLGVYHIDHELSYRTGRVVLPGVSSALKIPENLLVNVAKEMTVFRGIEVNFIELVDNLTEKGPVLHEVVGVFEY